MDGGAARLPEDETDRAHVTGNKQLRHEAETLFMTRVLLVAWHKVRITSGPPECTNMRTHPLKRQPDGFADRSDPSEVRLRGGPPTSDVFTQNPDFTSDVFTL